MESEEYSSDRKQGRRQANSAVNDVLPRDEKNCGNHRDRRKNIEKDQFYRHRPTFYRSPAERPIRASSGPASYRVVRTGSIQTPGSIPGMASDTHLHKVHRTCSATRQTYTS